MIEKLPIKTRLISLLSYLPILFFLPLGLLKDNEFVHYHAKQGAILFVSSIVVIISFWISVLGWVFLAVFLVVWLAGIINVLTGKQERLPIVGLIAEKISL
ncbi:MAG: hypothetical protein Athens101428_564 [Candidatus Berkelbacteria bacterium Athens1014_28]|uniref:Uncharacterized protein n=1 Tax=Candidatus Berkelbacteria bacterium Athens1014_28 TaxID=2017145 RepID=A0A554LLG8_9BACT|nr:MAG: hypothetical protein Athens101428_564 [Candidatus Berkelbacteria bacterium Athens1014_28]